MNNQYPSWEDVVKLRIELRDTDLLYWLQNCFFSFEWWIVLLLTIVPWIVWWKLVDKSRLTEVLLYGLMITVITTVFDVIGVGYVLWGYPIMLEPVIPPMTPANLTVFPTAYMLLYQYFPKWKAFFFASVGLSFIFSYIGEPVMEWLNIYQRNNWKSIYSFPIYIAIGLLLKYIMEKIISKQITGDSQ